MVRRVSTSIFCDSVRGGMVYKRNSIGSVSFFFSIFFLVLTLGDLVSEISVPSSYSLFAYFFLLLFILSYALLPQ